MYQTAKWNGAVLSFGFFRVGPLVFGHERMTIGYQFYHNTARKRATTYRSQLGFPFKVVSFSVA